MATITSRAECEVILGNSNPRFSGVTSTLLQTLAFQQTRMKVRVLGEHHLPDPGLAISFFHAMQICRTPLTDGRWRVFHARRNNEMLQALALKKLFGAKILIVFTSTAQRKHSRFTRWLMGQMDGILSTCNAAAAYLKYPCDQIIPHGIPTDVFFPATNRRELWQQIGLPCQFGIGIFGRVRAQKGIHHFVNACLEVLPNHPDFGAVIVGAIAEADKEFVMALQQRIMECGLEQRIRFLGEQDFAAIPGLFRAMTLICALSRNEGFGLTVLEAMASGAAVLATQAGAWPDIIREGVDGYCVEADNYTAIRDAMGKLLENPEALYVMGQQGRARALQDYPIEREAELLCAFYRQLQAKHLLVRQQAAGQA